MARAKLTTPEGIVVEMEGSPEEITNAVDGLRTQLQAARAVPKKKGKTQIADLVSQLKHEEFFTKPRGLGEIQKRLADLGHNYPVTTLSGAMQSQARRRELRRYKQGGKYVYVQ